MVMSSNQVSLTSITPTKNYGGIAGLLQRTFTLGQIVRGVWSGVRGAQFPGGRITMGAPKSPVNVASTLFNTVRLLPEDLRFEHSGAKYFLAPGAN